jgi:hypothetical protein
MPAFRVVVHGILSPKQTSAGALARGFYAAKAVRAQSQAAAELQALELVQTDPRVPAMMAGWDSAAPDLAIDFVVPLTAEEFEAETPQGFIFYDESGELAGRSE